MKKLFTAALGALLVFGLAACGGGKKEEEQPKDRAVSSFDNTVIADGEVVYGMTGPSQAYIGGEAIGAKAWGDNDGSIGAATAVSLRTVAAEDLQLAIKLEGMVSNLKGLYMVEKVELGHQAVAGYPKGGYKADGTYAEVDGVFTVKFVKYDLDEMTEDLFIDTWIPSPEGYSESLTPDLLWPHTHSEDKDEHGLDHNADMVNFGGAGEYTYFLAVYKAAQNGSFYGVAAHKDKALDPYVAPADTPAYTFVGAWNGWDNAGGEGTWLTPVEGEEDKFELTLTVEAGNNGRVVNTGSWDTAANLEQVTVGADLVEDDNGGDHNLKFLAGGQYRIVLNVAEAGNTLEVYQVAA